MDASSLIDIEKLRANIVDNLSEQWGHLIALLPNLLGSIIILLIGIIIAFVIRKISTSILRKIGLDRISRKAGVTDVMEDAGLARKPSIIGGKIIFWLVLFIFMVPAANALGMNELVSLFKSLIAFLPKIITAMVILIFGMMFAHFLRRTIAEKPSTLGSNSAKTLGNLVYGVMVTVIVLVALEQLEIETSVLHNIILLVVAGIMLSLAFSAGMGARMVAKNLLTGIYAREHFKPGCEIEVNGISGTIKEVNALSIVILLGENETVSVPNSTLYETEVKIREE